MPENNEPFTTFEPGQLITAAAINAMQAKMRAEIAVKIAEAIAALTEIQKSKDSDALGGKTAEELLKKFLEEAMQQFPSHTGYRRYIKVLVPNEPNLIEHDLKLHPLVDLYELLSFPVICAHDDDRESTRVRFFLYHTSERRIRDDNESANIEESGQTPFRILVGDMLDYLGVEYNEETSLGDLETELWSAMFASPNDQPDSTDYCHSPWYERCCRENKTVGNLKARGDWDELWLKMRPAKTVNPQTSPAGEDEMARLPRNILVEQHDFDRLSLTLREEPNREPQAACIMALLKV